jgi:hypothetical protein
VTGTQKQIISHQLAVRSSIRSKLQVIKQGVTARRRLKILAFPYDKKIIPEATT